MTLLEVMTELHSFDENDIIYAKPPWTPDSSAMVLPFEVDENDEIVDQPAAAVRLGMTHLVLVDVARGVLEDWVREFKPDATDREKCERLIEYVINDA